MGDYNYASFSFALGQPGVERWLEQGPKPGTPAPGFEAESLDGRIVSLADLRGRPVVIEFGSYTCPIFCANVEPMEAVAERHPEVAFLVIYTREAHPGELIAEHHSMEDKRRAAKRLAAEEPIGRTLLVDDLEGTVHRSYGTAWDAVYVIDGDGLVVLRQAWPHPHQVEAVLANLAAGEMVEPRETIEMASPSGRPMGEGLLLGGKRALLDFYRTAPPPVQQRLRESPSQAVRAALTELADS